MHSFEAGGQDLVAPVAVPIRDADAMHDGQRVVDEV
jgi:hypothetical protein